MFWKILSSQKVFFSEISKNLTQQEMRDAAAYLEQNYALRRTNEAQASSALLYALLLVGLGNLIASPAMLPSVKEAFLQQKRPTNEYLLFPNAPATSSDSAKYPDAAKPNSG